MPLKKVFFSSLALMLVVTILASIVTLTVIESNFKHNTSQSIKAVRNITHQAIVSWSQENELHIQLLAQTPEVKKLAEELLAIDRTSGNLISAPAQQSLKQFLSPVLEKHELRGYFIIDANHISIASSRISNIGSTNLIDNQSEFMKRLWQGKTVTTLPQPSDVALQDNNGVFIKNYPTMFVGTPIINAQGKIIAIFTLRIDPTKNLRKILQRGRIGDSGESYLINRQGYLLSESRFDHELIKKGLITSNNRSTFNIQAIEPKEVNASTPLTFMAEQVNQGKSGSNADGYFDYRGKKVIGSWLWDEKFQFGLATEVDYDEAYLPFSKTKQSFAIFTACAMLVFATFAWIFARIYNKMQTNKEQVKTLFDNAGDPILIVDFNSGNILSANKLSTSFFKYSDKTLVGSHVSILCNEDSHQKVLSSFATIRRCGGSLFETTYKNKFGNVIFVEVNAKLVKFNNSDVVLAIIRDISARKAAQQKLQELVSTDMLTKLGNRSSFDKQLSLMLANQEKQKKVVILMLIGIDEFRIVNDTLGHATGDIILKTIAKRIKNAIPDNAYLYRFGGDEFTVISAIPEKNEKPNLCKIIQQTMKTPITVNSNKIHLTMSIGIAFSNGKNINSSTLLQSADRALNSAKEHGRNCCQIFTEHMRYQDEQQFTILAELRNALTNNEFYLCFQPVVSVKDHQLVGAEALIRWQNPKLGFVSPETFISIAERSGAIIDIGNWVLEEVCKTYCEWQTNGFRIPSISINLSPVQLLNSDIEKVLLATLAKYRMTPDCIALEITEGVLLSEREELHQLLMELKQMGFRLYLDDFGTGYSSLSYLNKYPFDYLKMDKSFITDMEDNVKHRNLAKTVIAMANSLELAVIAEGVENQWQVDFLTKNNCQRIQGYFFGKPVKKSDFLSQWATEKII